MSFLSYNLQHHSTKKHFNKWQKYKLLILNSKYQATLTSQCASRNTRTSPDAASAPASRARIKPRRSVDLTNFTMLSGHVFFIVSSSSDPTSAASTTWWMNATLLQLSKDTINTSKYQNSAAKWITVEWIMTNTSKNCWLQTYCRLSNNLHHFLYPNPGRPTTENIHKLFAQHRHCGNSLCIFSAAQAQNNSFLLPMYDFS